MDKENNLSSIFNSKKEDQTAANLLTGPDAVVKAAVPTQTGDHKLVEWYDDGLSQPQVCKTS